MLLGFKTELKLNNQQRTLLAKHCGVARHAWNWGLWLTKNILDHNQANPNDKLRFPSAIDLHKLLVAMVKPGCPWYYECSKATPQQALMALREAWKRCFTKVSAPPKFKKKGKDDSCTLEGTVKVLSSNKIQVPKIGVLKTYESLPQVPVKSCTISRKADRWYISYRLEIPEQTSQYTASVGVDLGIKTLATLSTGEVISSPRAYKHNEAQLARLQYLNRHKKPGSNNYRKAQLKVARLHQRIANIRKDTLHKLTHYLAKNHGVVVINSMYPGC